MPLSDVQTFDGVGAVTRGDLLTVVYARDARLHRTRWAFDVVDQLARERSGTILTLMVIPQGSAPPDAATRAENARRFRLVLHRLRLFVTVPLGNAFQVSLVKAVMRAAILMQGHRALHLLADSEQEGIARITRAAGPETPAAEIIRADLQYIRQQLTAEGVTGL